MSVHRRVTPAGSVSFQVKWRAGGRARSRSFPVAAYGSGARAETRARTAAGTFDEEVRQQLVTTGVVVERRGATLLRDSWVEWFREGSMHWTPDTQETYASVLDVHILPRLGGEQLAAIKPATVERFIGDMKRDGVGPSAIAKTTTVLSSLLAHAVRDDQIVSNPVHAARKISAPRARTPLKIEPLQVETIRKWFIDRELYGDATLISLLAYAGLRPESEAIVLDWRAVGTKLLHVAPNLKRGAKKREVTLLDPLAEDLRDWRRRSGRIGGLIVPFGGGGVSPFGEEWTGDDWDRWRGKTGPKLKNSGERATIGRWAKARDAAGLPKDAIPRDLRGSFASLLIWEGRSVIDVARQTGHKPSTCLDVYAGEFGEFDPVKRQPAVDVIREAREQVFGSPGLSIVQPMNGTHE